MSLEEEQDEYKFGKNNFNNIGNVEEPSLSNQKTEASETLSKKNIPKERHTT